MTYKILETYYSNLFGAILVLNLQAQLMTEMWTRRSRPRYFAAPYFY